MTELFFDYKEKVVADYLGKRGEKDFSPRLARLSPANLKQECIARCKRGIDRKDHKNLMVFFDKAKDADSLTAAIEKCEIDKFKPLVKFLRNQTTNPDPKYIELLAWLIDFEPRPYEYGRKYTSAVVGTPEVDKGKGLEEREKKVEMVDAAIKEAGLVDEEPTSVATVYDNEINKTTETAPTLTKPTNTKKLRIVLILLILVAATIVGIFWPKPGKQQAFALTGNESCMFWAGDHFEPVSCRQKLGDTLVIALDSVRLIQFKKITQPDTITTNAIGYVWYVKVNGNLEYYTANGNHPVHPELRLRPITRYMIEKHIKSNGQIE